MDNVIPFPPNERANVTSIADVLRGMGVAEDLSAGAADRVHKVARDAKVMSHMVVRTMRTLGYEGIKSPSSRVDLTPIEREALIATVDAEYPRDPRIMIRLFLRDTDTNNPA